MSMWHDLLGHPAWAKLDRMLRDQKETARERLMAVARMSQDAAVRAEAMRIDQIDRLLSIPRDEAEKAPVE